MTFLKVDIDLSKYKSKSEMMEHLTLFENLVNNN